MDVADLKTFEAVARLGGMSRAATELNTVQSGVTARIRLLEERLGAELFDRHSRGVALTPAGRRLLPYAKQVLALIEDARKAVADDGSPKGPLVIGSLETTAAVHLSPMLASYLGACPDVDLALRTGTTCELIEGVLDRRLEGAFVCGPVNHPELDERLIVREELVVLTTPGHEPLGWHAGPAGLKIAVLRAGCSYRQRLEEILARRGIVGLRVAEFGTLEAIYGCVAAGLGTTLLPRRMVENVWRDGRVAIHTLTPEESMVDTVFTRRRDGHFSSALSTFLAHVDSAARAQMAA